MRRRDSTRLAEAIAAVLDRRQFMLGLGAVAAASVLPLTVAAGGAGPAEPALTDWTIDDMWGVYPRYADRIPFGRQREESAARPAPADEHFVP